MSYIYRGNAVTEVFGHVFPNGEPVELVAEKLPRGITLEMAQRKLDANPHFEKSDQKGCDDERGELLKLAESLGLRIHPATKTENIRRKIEEASV